MTGLAGDTFIALLPLLRRTFATFDPAERRRLGDRVRQGPARPALAAAGGSATFDPASAEAVLPLVVRLLGLELA